MASCCHLLSVRTIEQMCGRGFGGREIPDFAPKPRGADQVASQAYLSMLVYIIWLNKVTTVTMYTTLPLYFLCQPVDDDAMLGLVQTPRGLALSSTITR